MLQYTHAIPQFYYSLIFIAFTFSIFLFGKYILYGFINCSKKTVKPVPMEKQNPVEQENLCAMQYINKIYQSRHLRPHQLHESFRPPPMTLII